MSQSSGVPASPKIFRCICGREFEKAVALYGHKSRCKEAQIEKYGSLDHMYETIKHTAEKSAETNRKRHSAKAELLLQTWISEKHVCESCGKIMTVKYGSGRFCNSFCANSHVCSEETRKKSQTQLDNHLPNMQALHIAVFLAGRNFILVICDGNAVLTVNQPLLWLRLFTEICKMCPCLIYQVAP